MKSVMNHNFSQISPPQIQRSTFNRSHGLKTAFDSALLIPIFLDEILPGDTVKLSATFLGRLSTFIFPIMDNIFMDFFFFFVPARLLWSNWEKFNGAQNAPGDSTDYTIPHISKAGGGPLIFGDDSIYDYFGLPTNVTIATVDAPSSLPLRAYNLIFNQWFRDENLQTPLSQIMGDGPDTDDNFGLVKRGKRHDYFSSCLPSPQKGASVTMPLGSLAPVIGNGTAVGFTNGTLNFGGGATSAADSGTYSLKIATTAYGTSVGTTLASAGTSPTGTKSLAVVTDPTKSGMVADLSSATAATINQIRQAFQFQKILERDNRGGTRYTEMIKAHFGVVNPDFRLQRAEYLGGSSQRINIAAVQQTSETDATPQGTLSAFVQAHGRAGFNKSFTEHGYIIGLANVRADITYQQTMNKLWSRKTRFDFYLPALANLGEQAVLKKEIYYVSGGATANDVFGYQERWAEYRYKPSFVTSAMRSNYSPGGLDAWHLALDFNGTAPSLNNTFIVDNPPIDRVIAVQEVITRQVILDCYFEMAHTRPMPTYSVPGNIDRF